jgi:hypothetical protein
MPLDKDALNAAVDLVGRSGATHFEVGHLDDTEFAADARWWARAQYRGARIFTEDHVGPAEAAEALARKVLEGGLCTGCERRVRLGPADEVGRFTNRCSWARVGDRWERGCT